MSETISVHNMFSPCSELGIFMYSMNNLSSYCGLVDTKIRASDKDLPVQRPLGSTRVLADEKLIEKLGLKNISWAIKHLMTHF